MVAPRISESSLHGAPGELLSTRTGITRAHVSEVTGPRPNLAGVSKAERNRRLREESEAANPEPWWRHSVRNATGVRSASSPPGGGGIRVAEDRDHAAEQRDQAADHRDEAGDQRDQAGVQRDHAAEQRDQTGEHRDEAGDHRDQAGDERDQTAEQRDQAADERDQAADKRDQTAEQSEGSAGDPITADALSRSALARREAASDRRRASLDRRAGASERTEAELDRTTALADRGAGASERTQAELDRSTALADRGASARERVSASMDDLTGTYLRGAGFVELEREMARARRTRQALVVAFVDVDHLKAINDSHGHAAGDRMLLQVANTLGAKLRAYDLVIRYGGDEFVCAIAGVSMAEAAKRLALVNAVLAEAAEEGSVTVGLAELQPDDSAGDLVARADAALYRERQGHRSA